MDDLDYGATIIGLRPGMKVLRETPELLHV